jgi:hypothetical protein
MIYFVDVRFAPKRIERKESHDQLEWIGPRREAKQRAQT